MTRTFTSFLSFLLIFSLAAAPVHAATDGFSTGVSSAELRQKYENDKIRILVVVGHEPGYGGAIYQGVYEREIVTDISKELESLLRTNPKYEVIVSRTDTAWNKTLEKYFDKQEKKIEKFVKDQKKKTKRMERKGDIEDKAEHETVAHGAAPNDVALRLYGINKWANENKIDLVVHLHVNDAPDHGPDEPSKYTGYAVYVPDTIFGNHKASKDVAHEISRTLAALSPISTLPGESLGVVPDRELIAVGAYGTLNVPSVLIEYGYITEPRFTLPEHREQVAKDTAYQTYLALQSFFGEKVTNPRTVEKLPIEWPKPVATTTLDVATTTPDTATSTATTTPSVPVTTATECVPFTDKILPAKGDEVDTTGVVKRLQTILAKDKTIYPEGLVTGYFGPATLKAVQAFQKKHNIVSEGTPETTGYGAVGPKTASALLAFCKAN